MSDFLTVKQASEISGLAPITIYQYLQRGKIPAQRFGHQWQIPSDVAKSLKPGKPGRPKKDQKRE